MRLGALLSHRDGRPVAPLERAGQQHLVDLGEKGRETAEGQSRVGGIRQLAQARSGGPQQTGGGSGSHARGGSLSLSLGLCYLEPLDAGSHEMVGRRAHRERGQVVVLSVERGREGKGRADISPSQSRMPLL